MAASVCAMLQREEDPARTPLPGTPVDTPPRPVAAVPADVPGSRLDA